MFVVNVYTSSGSFDQCHDSYIALRADTDHDASDGKTIAKFRLGAHIQTRGIVFAKVSSLTSRLLWCVAVGRGMWSPWKMHLRIFVKLDLSPYLNV